MSQDAKITTKREKSELVRFSEQGSNQLYDEYNINTKLEDLKSQVDWFYSDDFDLDLAVDNYEKATKLATEIEKDLTELKNRVEVISKDFGASSTA